MSWDGSIEGGMEYLLPDVRIVRARREPCIVCGHPTGDCADNAVAPRTIIGEYIERPPDKPVDVLVPEDIYEERQITPFTRAKVLLAAKGTFVSTERAIELGIL